MGLTIFFHKEMVIQVYVPKVHNIVYCLCEFSKDQICAKISLVLFLKVTNQPKKKCHLLLFSKTKNNTFLSTRNDTAAQHPVRKKVFWSKSYCSNHRSMLHSWCGACGSNVRNMKEYIAN